VPVIAKSVSCGGLAPPPLCREESHDTTLSTSKGPTFDPLTRGDPNTTHGTDIGR